MSGGIAQPGFALVYEDRRIALFDGEVVLGRALTCQIRFNAPTVSREHVRLEVKGGLLIAENMSLTSGTRVNGRRLLGKWSVLHGDELELGPVRLRVERISGDTSTQEPPAPAADEGLPEESTLPGQLGDFDEYAAVAPGVIAFHTCPACRAKVSFSQTSCPSCGYRWPASNPGTVTQQNTMPNLAAHLLPTPAVVPLVYSSEELTLDVNVEGLRRDGVFVPALLLDPVGTTCELTLLPDGAHPMTIAGAVTSVRATADAQGPAGMEVQFRDMPPIVTTWLERWLVDRGR